MRIEFVRCIGNTSDLAQSRWNAAAPTGRSFVSTSIRFALPKFGLRLTEPTCSATSASKKRLPSVLRRRVILGKRGATDEGREGLIKKRGLSPIIPAFVQLREMLASNKELAKKLDELERKLATHDRAIADILNAIRELMRPPEPPPKRRIGFIQD